MPRGAARPDLIRAAALRLFAERGVAATSLQHIATELGVTKAAVYHHYRAKADIVLAVLEPALACLAEIITAAGGIADRAERTRWVIESIADQAVQHRGLYAVMLADATATQLVATNRSPDFDTLSRLLTTADPGQRVRVAMFLSALTAPATDPDLASINDADLRAGIASAGERLLFDSPASPLNQAN